MTSPLYANSGKVSLASKLSMLARTKMFKKFMDVMKPHASDSVLDLGVTCDERYQESNFFESMYPYKEKIVCVGTEDGSHLEKKYPGIRFLKVNSGENLPFKDNEFDILFSNAVIEHAGNNNQQQVFVKELMRVSKSFFLTTPNRWFPIEFHTVLPLVHFLPKKIHRHLLSLLDYKFWSKEENLNLLSKRQLHALFGNSTEVVVDTSVKLFGICTNLIVYKKS